MSETRRKAAVLWWLAAVMGLLGRLAFAWYAQHRVDQSLLDVQTYTRIAQNLLDGYGFSLVAPHPTVFVAPLYPLLLAVVRWVTGGFSAMLAVHGFLWILIAWLVRRIGEIWFGPTVAFLGSVFVLWHPELIAISGFMYSETMFVALLYGSLAVLALVWGGQGSPLRPSLWATAGALLALATLTRPVTLYLFPLWAAMPLLVRQQRLRQKALCGFALIGAFLVFIAPWTVRNYVRTRHFVPVAVGGGIALWTGNYFPYNGEYRYEKTRKLIADLTRGLDEVEADKRLTRLAVGYIRKNPGKAIKLFVRKLGRYWFKTYEKVPDGRPRSRTPIGYALFLVHLAVLAFAAIGLFAYRADWRRWTPFVLFALYMTGIHALSLPVPRYRLPLLPGLLLFTAAGVVYLVELAKPGWVDQLWARLTQDGGEG